MKKDKFTGLLTLDQLKSLKLSGLNETDRKSIFGQALDFYSEKVRVGKQTGERDPFEAAGQSLIHDFLPLHVPPVKYIGSGLARFAFAGEDGHVCKFAVDSAGMRQNHDEIKTLRKYGGWPCFVKMYDFDAENGFGLDVEAVAVIGEYTGTAKQMLYKLGAFGRDLDNMLYRIMTVCRRLSSYGFDVERVARSFYSEQYDEMLELTNNIVQAKTVQAKIFRKLAEYYKNELSEHRTGFDDLHSGNVGYAYRDGELVLVILDVGS